MPLAAKLGAPITIRPLSPEDSIAELTALLHRAYAGLAARGLNYTATYQDEAKTRERCRQGECYLAQIGGRLAGTVTLLDEQNTRGTPWYDQPGVACFGQFGVEPDLQRCGIGSRLLDFIERRASEKELIELACDTAEESEHLVRWYKSRGYRFIEYTRWQGKRYRSVVLSKSLRRP